MAAPGLILGIDPGLAATGYALLRDPAEVVACGTIRTAPTMGRGARLLHIQREIEGLLIGVEIGEAALEELFMGNNRTSVLGVAEARGAILVLLESRGIPVHEYKPAQVKMTLTGYGMADKTQMARMLAAQLRLTEAPGSDHAVDAIAIAICHSRSRRVNLAGSRTPR
jgi:crossover junction endodeoxyribonuclease RuvC